MTQHLAVLWRAHAGEIIHVTPAVVATQTPHKAKILYKWLAG